MNDRLRMLSVAAVTAVCPRAAFARTPPATSPAYCPYDPEAVIAAAWDAVIEHLEDLLAVHNRKPIFPNMVKTLNSAKHHKKIKIKINNQFVLPPSVRKRACVVHFSA